MTTEHTANGPIPKTGQEGLWGSMYLERWLMLRQGMGKVYREVWKSILDTPVQ